MRVSCLQVEPKKTIEGALVEALELATSAVKEGSKFLFLPEYCGGISSNGTLYTPPSEYEKNQVKLSDNNFSTELYNIELGVYPTPRTAFFSNFQYDDVSNALGLFAKLQHTMTPGSDLYLVYTHNWKSLSESIFDFNLKTFSKISSFKINYTIRL